MNLEKIKMFEIVELVIPNDSSGRVNFKTQPQLRNQADQVIIIKGIKVYPVYAYSNSQQTAGLTGVAITELPKAVLVLYVNGWEAVHMIPLNELVHVQDPLNGGAFQQEIQAFADLQNVDWDKSYVQFSIAASGSPYIIPFGIEYVRLQRDPSAPDKWIEA